MNLSSKIAPYKYRSAILKTIGVENGIEKILSRMLFGRNGDGQIIYTV